MLGRSVTVTLVVDPEGSNPGGNEPTDVSPMATALATRRHLSVAPPPPPEPESTEPSADDDVDLSALIDADDASAPSMLNELTKVFPGAQIVE
jgi:hypothetical protein